MPREARDTLFLLAVIAWTITPHLAQLPAWCGVLTLIVLLWRGRLAIANESLPGRWVLVGVLAIAIGLTLLSYRTLLGKEPGIAMVVALMALKTLELRARRDAFVVFFLGFFLILTHFLYSQTLLVAAAMVVSVWGLLTAVVLAHMPVGVPSLRRAGALAARTALFGAPVMALLFVLFPRVSPLWGVPDDGVSKSGLSNTMRMGSVAQVALSEAIAMRVKFDGPVPPRDAFYFRGPVLTRFDGVEWRPVPLFAPLESTLRPRGRPIRYEATVEPLRLATIPMLEATRVPPRVDGYGIGLRGDLQVLADRPIYERIRFTGEAYLDYTLGPMRRPGDLGESLHLPDGFNPRTLAWAAALRRDPRYAGADAATWARTLLQHIRGAGFSYTLAPSTYGRDAVDEFWLDRREGFCEHFAASFVVIMRALGVPARIVTGYQGADPEPVDGYYIVRESSAHAWAEYWQADIGWVRADPTAAVAPDRIGRSNRLVAAPGFVAEALGNVSPELMASLRNGWEALNNRWNQWVLNYSRGQQFDALRNLGFSSPSWQDLAFLLIGALSVLALAGALWAWFDRHRVDPWVRQLERLRAELRRLGIAAEPHEPPRALAARARARLGADAEPLVRLLDDLERQRYGRGASERPDRALTREFTARARALRPAWRGAAR
ncbi:DUF3488 domain-containing transglutaminase family protein [Schlegelella sp. ID0723]|uniref:DUF3488 domain-containing transglutaminase family protein n=1 Tax=Piscinibacter koreensis TaxID=2742824 RepID=A0A7Y6NKS1_9BURK|nr:DUF3488 domain-containing transglutaminase family protein [Schlegelella koreensis]